MVMAKRFTDSEKWADPWFMDLPNKYKLFWLYLLDSCNHAGVWKVNFKVANFYIGEHLEPSEVKRVLSARVNIIDDTYWYIEKFITFQYGGIKNDNVGKSVQKILERHNLLGACEGLPSPLAGTKDKAKDKDMVKVKEKAEILELGDTSQKHFVIITPKYANEKAYRLWGVDGVGEFLEMNGSKWPRVDYAEKFLRDKSAQPFNDFGHILNAYNLYIKNQFK